MFFGFFAPKKQETVKKMKQKRLILASASPRRRDILTTAGYDFEVYPSNATESVSDGTDLYKTVVKNALAKARDVFQKKECPEDCVVLGADTLVCVDGIALGKPGDNREAAEMLRRLSGREHSVVTGIALVDSCGEKTDFSETFVKFRNLTEKEILDYVATGEPMDKAGSYGLQERGCLLVEGIKGDFFNVVGLPVVKVYALLEKLGK